MSSESEAAKEIAKTTGKAIEAAQAFGGFISRFIGGSAEQAAGMLEDWLRVKRFEKQILLMDKVNKILSERGITLPNREIPLKLLLPIVEQASIEEDDSIHSLWANLLANFGDPTSGVNVEMVYVDILKSISPVEAKIMDSVYSLDFESALHEGILTKDLPYSVICRPKELERADLPTSEIILALANLDRLGCLSIKTSMGGGQLFGLANPTLLGKKFVEACIEHK
jgi:hypothetical protein